MINNPLQSLSDRYDIVLASGSPRRRELLAMLALPYVVDTSHSVDEVYPADLPVEEIPEYLSRLKAMAVPMADDDRRLVITADTVVILDGEVLGKPADAAEASLMLEKMAGKRQMVVTGVTVRTASRCESFSEKTFVGFSPLSAEEISFYVNRFSPFDKAGAYGIQEWIGAAGINGIDGSFYNVMGLPVHHLYKVLKTF